MMDLPPVWLIAIGFVLVIFGAVVPFLMVMNIITPSFWLSFVVYAAQVSGLILGLIGGLSFVRRNRR